MAGVVPIKSINILYSLTLIYKAISLKLEKLEEKEIRKIN